MRVLVTGAGGMLAHEAVLWLRAEGWDVTALTRAELDVTRTADVRAAVAAARPDWVWHLAAYTDVDGCESNLEHAMRVNADGAGNAAAAARDAGASVLSISSDYVFPGDDPTPRRETDPVGPLSAYGRSKLAGEEAVRAATPNHLIVRTAWLYGAGGRNFVDTIRARALAGTPLTVVDDQHGSPTWTRMLVGALIELTHRRATGTFHATNGGACTWYEFACAICERLHANEGLHGRHQFEVGRQSSAELARPARRPAWSVLDTGRLEATLGHPMLSWQGALALYLKQPVPEFQERRA